LPVNVELRHLRSFLVVAEELNFTRAAARLHLAQQALSTQIQQLERELGVTLFVRTTRQVSLTSSGRKLLDQLPGAVSKVDSLLSEIAAQANGAGQLTLGLLATSLLEFTPRLLRTFAAERPNVSVTIRNVPFSDPSGGVRDGQCDAALVWEPFQARDIECQALFEDERVAVLAADHPLAKLPRVPAELLAAEPFVWVDDMDPVARDFWTLSEQRGGRPARVGARITGFEDLFAAVRAGQAVAASPSSIAGALPWPDLTIRPVEGLPPAVVSICRRAGDGNPVVDALVECALRVAREMGTTLGALRNS
jgi:DNA-binding transcriptional LysR family regulator